MRNLILLIVMILLPGSAVAQSIDWNTKIIDSDSRSYRSEDTTTYAAQGLPGVRKNPVANPGNSDTGCAGARGLRFNQRGDLISTLNCKRGNTRIFSMDPSDPNRFR